jgi:hypothetical protein
VSVDPHELARERSLAFHREIATRLRGDPRLIDAARARVSGWLNDRSVAEEYARAWQALLELPLDVLLDRITERTATAHDLRQVSPFAGVLDPRTRWRIHKAVGDERRR